MIMNIKQRKIKIEPKMKLSYNIHMYSRVSKHEPRLCLGDWATTLYTVVLYRIVLYYRLYCIVLLIDCYVTFQ